MKKTILFLILLPLAAFLGGCATGATSTAMQVALPAVEKQHPETISITVTGGKETNPLWSSQVSDGAFQDALAESINRTRVFSAILPGTEGDVLLEVTLVELKQPFIGLNMTVTARTRWVLRNRVDGILLWEKEITEAHTATPGDALYGVTRLKLANEGAIKAVVKGGVEELSRLKFK